MAFTLIPKALRLLAQVMPGVRAQEKIGNMNDIGKFKAVYCSGIFVPDAAAVTALSLLFEKVYLPNNVELISAFVKKYTIQSKGDSVKEPDLKILSEEGVEADPFSNLTESQRKVAYRYIDWGMQFSMTYSRLFGEVFETNLFEDGGPLKVELLEKGKPGQLNKYSVSPAPLCLQSKNENLFPSLLNDGYFPVVGSYHPENPMARGLDETSARQLAVLLAMKSIQLVLPRTKRAHPELILEARVRLSDQLPAFWSAMLKLTADLKQRVGDCKSLDDFSREAQELADITVLPALIDLKNKLEKERKGWFRSILSSVQRGLRLMVGNPPLTQQQLVTNALILSSDVAMSTAGKMQTIEALKQEAGLTFLLELQEM
jgi:hypothetical protein